MGGGLTKSAVEQFEDSDDYSSNEDDDSTGCSEIFDAAAEGDVSFVLKALRRGTDANIVEETVDGEFIHYAETPIFYAIRGAARYTPKERKKHLSLCKALLGHGAELNRTNTLGQTPLIVACQIGDKPIVSLLLSSNADLNTVDKGGHTALKWADRERNLEIVKLLLEHGADPRKPNYKYWRMNSESPLITVGKKDEEIRLLLETKAADLESQDHERMLREMEKERSKPPMTRIHNREDFTKRQREKAERQRLRNEKAAASRRHRETLKLAKQKLDATSNQSNNDGSPELELFDKRALEAKPELDPAS